MTIRWKIKWLPEAEKDLAEIDASDRKIILKKILTLEDEPEKRGDPLGNKAGLDLSGLYKLCAADGYRVVYAVFQKEIIVAVVEVGRRAKLEVYKSTKERIAKYTQGMQNEINVIKKYLK